MKALRFVLCLGILSVLPVVAGENLLVNPGFEEATCPAASNRGDWGWFKDGAIAVPGWRGSANAGIAKSGNTTWLPAGTGTWTAFIQRYSPWGAGLNSYIEQTVHIDETGSYEFSFDMALRNLAGTSASQIGFSVNDGETTTEYSLVTYSITTFVRQAYRLVLEAGKDYTFRLHGIDSNLADTTAMIDNCALVYLGDVTTPMTATWTGDAGTTDLLDAGNWDCYNMLGEKLEETVLPRADATQVTIPGASTFVCPVGATNLWKTIVFDGTKLRDGADLAGLDFSRAKGTLDLNGCSFTIRGFDGTSDSTCQLTDTSSGERGEIRFTIGAGTNYVHATMPISGNVRVVKDGPGTLTWGGGTLAADIPILITNGVFRMGVTTADVFGDSGTIIVKDKGQFDVNYGVVGGSSPVVNKTFEIEGDGPDGSGALGNWAPYDDRLWSYTFSRITLTGDATIGGTARVDVRGDGNGVTGPDYVLTIKNTGRYLQDGGTTVLNVRRFVCRDGGVFQPCQGGGVFDQIAEGIFLYDGGICLLYHAARNSNVFTMQTSLTVGTGGGLLTGAADGLGNCGFSGRVHVKDGGTLNVGATMPNCTFADLDIDEGATLLIPSGTGALTISGTCANDGVIRQESGTLAVANAVTGTGMFDFAAGHATMSGDLSAFLGRVRTDGSASVAVEDVSAFASTLILVDGTVTSDLSPFRGTAVIDLSARTDAFDIGGHGWNTLKDLEVTVRLEGRTLTPGERLLTWATDEQPQVSFVPDAETAESGVALVASPTGLFYGADPESTEVDLACWTGAAGDGVWTNAQNWACTNAAGYVVADGLPGTAARVCFKGSTAIQIPASSPLVCARIEFKDFSLAADCDWRGFDLDAVPPETVIDLRGHRLTLAGRNGTTTVPFTVTDTLDHANCVSNGSFEEQTVISANSGKWGRSAQVSTAIWTLGNPGVGLSNGNSTWVTSTKDGNTYAILQIWSDTTSVDSCHFEQTVTVPTNGTYRLSLWFAGRKSTSSNFLRVEVDVDGREILDLTPIDRDTWHEFVRFVDLTAGTHELKFRGVRNAASGDYAAFIDKISLVRSDDFGELHVDVPTGTTFSNTSITLAGNLRFVKDGAGTFVAAKTDQTYIGGNDVTAGTLKTGGDPANWLFGGKGLDWGGASFVRVRTGATVDLAQKNGVYQRDSFLLDGGTLKGENTVSCIQWLGIAANSTFEVADKLTYLRNAITDLRGQTLSLSIKDTFTSKTLGMTNGVLNVVKGGWFEVFSACDAATVDLFMNAAFKMNAALTVHDYVSTYSENYNSGTSEMSVCGTFKPVSDYFYGCTLLDGATLDLSERTGVWSATSRFTAGRKTVSFADGATIWVDVGNRRFKGDQNQLVAWGTAPSNLDKVSFKVREPRKGYLEVTAEGIYFHSGLAIFIR